MPKRQRFGRYYVTRTKDGRFKKFVNVGRSLSADRRRKGKTVKSGYGNLGDIAEREESYFIGRNSGII